MREPFPHVLTHPTKENNFLLRFVTDKEPSDTIYEPQVNGFRAFVVEKINNKRPAKGDWSKWPKHPTHYEAKGTYIGQRNKAE